MGENTIVCDDDRANQELLTSDAITPAMMRAGIAALAQWNYQDEEPEAAVAAIWYSMRAAQRDPSPPE